MRNLIKKMLDLYKEPRYRSIVNYIFFGVCTTLVNVVTYFILYYYGMEVRPANLISITLSILFNKTLVSASLINFIKSINL